MVQLLMVLLCLSGVISLHLPNRGHAATRPKMPNSNPSARDRRVSRSTNERFAREVPADCRVKSRKKREKPRAGQGNRRLGKGCCARVNQVSRAACAFVKLSTTAR